MWVGETQQELANTHSRMKKLQVSTDKQTSRNKQFYKKTLEKNI